MRFKPGDRELLREIIHRYPDSLGLNERSLERNRYVDASFTHEAWGELHRGQRLKWGLPRGLRKFPQDIKRVLGLPDSRYLSVVLYKDDVFLYDTRTNRVLDALDNVL